MSAIIFHNNNCSKSRASLNILKEKNIDFKVIKYLETPPTIDELRALLGRLNMDAKSLIRKSEPEYKQQNLAMLDEKRLIQAMVKYPQLIERPIIITDKGAVIGRPPENILTII